MTDFEVADLIQDLRNSKGVAREADELLEIIATVLLLIWVDLRKKNE